MRESSGIKAEAQVGLPPCFEGRDRALWTVLFCLDVAASQGKAKENFP
jgi:hypothetical protein